jgi:hypothetical protein
MSIPPLQRRLSPCPFLLFGVAFDVKMLGKQELVIVRTDLAGAFGSIRHSLIHVVLEHYGLDQELHAVIKVFIQIFQSER